MRKWEKICVRAACHVMNNKINVTNEEVFSLISYTVHTKRVICNPINNLYVDKTNRLSCESLIMEKLDIVIFGATGFTGQHVAKNLVRLNKNQEYANVTWGIAGRSMQKLQDILKQLESMGADISKIPIIVSDVSDENSVRAMTGKAKVVMNCTGPYSELGEQVVKCCIETRSHYVDITAELHFMLNMYRSYNKAAEDANVLIIPACGFGSIPGVMGSMHLQKQFKGTLSTVECYTELMIPRRAYFPGPNKCLVHYGTWASLVHELKNFRDYQELKKQTFPDPLFSEPEPEEIKKSFFHRHKGRFWFPYPGPDHDIIEMTERYLHDKQNKKPIHFKSYTTMPLLIHFVIIPFFLLYYLLSYFKCFRRLLWKYPRFFTLGYMSHKGPSEEMMRDHKYSFTLEGKGFINDFTNSEKSTKKSMTVKISGSDPGYGTTAVAFILSAITILKESSGIPEGGVLTTGAAFCNTQLVERLNNNGMKFEVIGN